MYVWSLTRKLKQKTGFQQNVKYKVKPKNETKM